MKLHRIALHSLLGLAAAAAMPGFVVAEPPVTITPPKVDVPKVAVPAAKDEPTIGSTKKDKTGNDSGFVKRHEGFLKDKTELLKNGPIQFVLVGDSITDGWRGGGKAVFEATYKKWNTYNIGIGGDRTQHVIWRIENGELDGLTPAPKAAMLMIGTNNTGPNKSDEEIAAGVAKCVTVIHEKLPTTKILLLGVFPRSMKADDAIRGRIKHINEIISKLDDGGKTVKYLDIGAKFLEADGTLPKSIMPDALHPNAKGYQIWADAVQPALDELMK